MLGGTIFDKLGRLALPGTPIFRDHLWKLLGKKGCSSGGAEKDNMVWGPHEHLQTWHLALQGGKRVRRVTTGASTAHEHSESKGKGAPIYLLHFLESL